MIRASISGDTVGFDFTGSAAQVRGAINATASYTKSASYLALKTALSEEIPTNSGFFRPYPLADGCPGTPARVSMVRDGVERKLPAKVSAELRRGDVVRIVIPRAAGWGPPLNRDPQRVLEDVRSEKFSKPCARRVYGVVFAEKRSSVAGPGALELDAEATRKLHRRRLRQRERRREQAERSTTR